MNAERREENIARLIRAGYAPGVRPGAEARERTWRRLAAELHAARAAFPDRALLILVGVLLVMAAWIGVQGSGLAVRGASEPFVAAAALLLAFNLVAVPVAGIVIVLRRKQHV